MEVQRWVIGKRLPKDHETLINLEVKTSGTVVFLYLLAAKEVGIRKLHSEENRRIVTNKMPSLPPRDYKQDDREPLPPLNSRDHRFATAPAIQGQDVGDRNEAAMKFLNEFACGAPDESMSTGKKVFPSGPKEMARTPQNESMRTQGMLKDCNAFVLKGVASSSETQVSQKCRIDFLKKFRLLREVGRHSKRWVCVPQFKNLHNVKS